MIFSILENLPVTVNIGVNSMILSTSQFEFFGTYNLITFLFLIIQGLLTFVRLEY